MNNKISSLIKAISENKKQFMELLIMDIVSLTVTLFVFLLCIFIIFAIANTFNIHCRMPFNIKFSLLEFSIIWYFTTVIIALIFHIKTMAQININGQRMMLNNDK